MGFFFLLYLVYIVALIVALWKMFEKAGRPGWEAIIPIYNLYVIIVHIVKKEWWWILLFLIPIVNIVAGVIICIALARAFGKDVGVGILCLIFGIGYFILGFGDAKYIGASKDAADEFLENLGKNNS